MTELPKSARRVEQAVSALGLSARIVCHAVSSRTAEDAAAACGCDVGQIIKSMIFQGKQSKTAYLILVSGKNRVNEKAAAKVLGEPLVRPDASFVREVTGFAIGGVPPVGHTNPVATYIDEELLAYQTAWGAAGTPECVMELNMEALREATGAEVISVV
ncbi:MAG: YbaK/EbsC family protein [Alphaproteobacteria bacterium]|nr:YbaK/EbsC family protein [Alphaproteobacteria bacterium]